MSNQTTVTRKNVFLFWRHGSLVSTINAGLLTPPDEIESENQMKENCECSVVIPVYNSASIFPELHTRLVSALEKVVDSFEIIAVLDGCHDNSFEVISLKAAEDNRVRLIELSRNFGHQTAITAGLQYASGKLVVIMDDDLEDPPEVIPSLINKSREGFDVVYGIRRQRRRALPYRILYSLFYRILGALVDLKIPYDAGDFCLMTVKVVETLKSMPENNRYLRGMRAWCGFAQTGVEYDRGQRFAEESGYTLKKYISLAFDAIFSFSYKPLKLVSLLGFMIAGLSFLYGLNLVVARLSGALAQVPGWVSLQVSILFFSGIQLISVGVLGEYMIRVYDEVKQRPKFVVGRMVGFSDNLQDE
jgi:glycosyltransferase involved in cell wall biosynthesis